MLTLHHLLVSQSDKVVWLLEELGVPHEIKTYTREDTMAAPPELKALHPLGQTPLIEDEVKGEGRFTLAESGAVFAYILETYDPDATMSVPKGEPGHIDYLYWFHYAASGLMPATMQRFVANMTKSDVLIARAEGNYAKHLAQLDDHLANRTWLAGDKFTAADILAHWPFAGARAFAEIDISDRPNILAWLKRVSARPTYQAAMKKAGWDKDMAAR